MINKQVILNILSEIVFGYKICESIEDKKILDYLYSNLLLEKLLVGEPLSIEELRKLLRKKIVNFEFIKLDGEVRPATGTLLMKYIPPKDHPKGIRPSSPKVATFYDLDKDAWRSVSRRSKEIVLKKDEKTNKPIIVVKDKSDVKVKPVVKKRESKDPIVQGQSYKYKTNRGTNTNIEILRELPNGLYQVSSPMFKTTFAIDASRIGNKFNPEPDPKDTLPDEPEQNLDNTTLDLPNTEPKEELPLKTNVVDVKPIEPEKKEPIVPAPIVKQTIPPIPINKSEDKTILLPQETKTAEEEEKETKNPPIDITPPEEEEGPEELKK